MRGVVTLAKGGLTARPVRTALLVAAVALSAALVAAVACAMGSINRSVAAQLEQQLGDADVRIRPATRGGSIDPSVLDTVRTWPEVARAEPRSTEAVTLLYQTTLLSEGERPSDRWVRTERSLRADAIIEGGGDALFDRIVLLAGRPPTDPSEIVLDALLAQRLSAAWLTHERSPGEFAIGAADVSYLRREPPVLPGSADAAEARSLNARVGVRPGDDVRVVRLFGAGPTLRVVGIAPAPPLGGVPRAYASVETAASAAGGRGSAGLAEIEIVLAEGADPVAFVDAYASRMGTGLVLQNTERITSGVERNLASNRVGFVLASVLAFLAASFIILTGLTTGLAEQQRALAIVRAIGGSRVQLAVAQLMTGAGVGILGGAVGVPLGIGLAWSLTLLFPDKFPSGLAVPPDTLAVAVAGALFAGVAGGSWPAYRAARMRPLEAMASRARSIAPRTLWITTVCACAALATMTSIVALPSDGQVVFWGYATAGAPLLMTGWFLACVPIVVVVSRVTAPWVSRGLRLPPGVLGRTVRATPFRHGFTAGAMMVGLALMVSLWTNGGSFMRDWLDRIEFPDAFVSGFRMPAEVQARTESATGVVSTSAISLEKVTVDTFGVSALQSYSTTFVAFEPEAFFNVVAVEWVEGSERGAIDALNAGGSVIVADEFRIAKGLGTGDAFVCRGSDGVEHRFEIAGVVRAPGLAMISAYFDFGESVTQQSLHYVFGSRRDMIEKFGNDTIEVLAVDIDDNVPDAVALPAISQATAGAGVLNIGSGRQIKGELIGFVESSLVVFSSVAVGSMLIACFGVANLVVAGIEARRFEFGVLRAVGASRGLLVRLVAGEALIVAITASIAGTAMGLHGAWAGQVLNRILIGIDMRLVPPVGAIALGWVFVIVLTLASAAPAMARLARREPRELLSAR